jgi:hypothetical protein
VYGEFSLFGRVKPKDFLRYGTADRAGTVSAGVEFGRCRGTRGILFFGLNIDVDRVDALPNDDTEESSLIEHRRLDLDPDIMLTKALLIIKDGMDIVSCSNTAFDFALSETDEHECNEEAVRE